MSQDGIRVEQIEGNVYRATVEALPLAVFFSGDESSARDAALRAIGRSDDERID
tara:strand:+ start:1915 stop:2076 length:162 start_codon:yes stop_codon:yes gene_type:complete